MQSNNKELKVIVLDSGIEIKEIEETSAPTDEYVYPPDDDFVPTSALF